MTNLPPNLPPVWVKNCECCGIAPGNTLLQDGRWLCEKCRPPGSYYDFVTVCDHCGEDAEIGYTIDMSHDGNDVFWVCEGCYHAYLVESGNA